MPAHPPGTSILTNIDSVQHSVLSNKNWLQRAKTWAWNVHNYNSPWSYQRIGNETGQGNLYDAFGNFNYGATGTALGIRDVTLLGAAGIAKWFNYAANKPPQMNQYWSQPWTNDPHKSGND